MGSFLQTDGLRTNQARALPAIVAAAGLVLVLWKVAPVDGAVGVALTALFVAGAALAMRQPAARAVMFAGAAPELPAHAMDEETGLGNHARMREALVREVARYRRYGRPGTLVVAEPRIIGFQPRWRGQEPPSPASFFAGVLQATRRDSDEAFRMDDGRFAVMLADCDNDGAHRFAERLEKELAKQPYARGDSGNAVWVQASLGIAPWLASIQSPDAFVEAAMTNLERSRAEQAAARNERRAAAAA